MGYVARPEHWSGQPFPSPGHLPNPGMEHRSPASQADSLPAEPWGKPKITGVGRLCLLLGTFLNWTRVSYIAGGFFTRWAYQEKVKVKLAHSCPTLCPWTVVHGILQARILEWAAFPFSRASSQPRDWTQVSHIPGGFFTSWAKREVWAYWKSL